ncbi:hypothetical protein J6590_012294 [Homalodisca vitripennis]|nr:hypothetical protein J6590_012294 [Homalodisca vitripennis]
MKTSHVNECEQGDLVRRWNARVRPGVDFAGYPLKTPSGQRRPSIPRWMETSEASRINKAAGPV